MDTMDEKIKEIEITIIDKSKDEDEEKVARMTNLITERIGRTETGKRQKEIEVEREETKKKLKN